MIGRIRTAPPSNVTKDGWWKTYAYLPHKVWIDDERTQYRWVWLEPVEERYVGCGDVSWSVYRFPKEKA